MTSLLNKLYNLFKIFYRWFYKTQTLHGCKKSITKQEAIKHQFPFPIVRQREGEGDTRPRPTSNHISLSVSHFFLCVKSTLRVGWLAFIFFFVVPNLFSCGSHFSYKVPKRFPFICCFSFTQILLFLGNPFQSSIQSLLFGTQFILFISWVCIYSSLFLCILYVVLYFYSWI